MKKQTVVIIWATAILLLVVTCCALYLVWDINLGGKNTPIEAFSCMSSEIEGYTVINSDEVYTLQKDDGIWELEDNKKAEIDQDVVSKMIASASKITANGTISRKELQKFDLTDKKTIKLDLDDKDDVTIEFVGTSQNICAIKLSGDRKIYAVYAATRDILTPGLDSLRIKRVFDIPDKEELMPQYFSYTDYDQSVLEVRTKTSQEFAESKDNRYIMTKPYQKKYEVDDELFEQQFAVKIPLIRARKFLEKPENLAGLGLDKESRAVLEFKWGKTNEILYLGKSEGGTVYAMKENSDGIFTVDSSAVEFLQTDPFYILEGSILKADADAIVKINVNDHGNFYEITSTGRGTADSRFYINRKVASETVFKKIIDQLEDIKFLQGIEAKPKNTKDITINVLYQNAAAQQAISLVPMGEKAYTAFVDGVAEFTVNKVDVDEFLQTVKGAVQSPVKAE